MEQVGGTHYSCRQIEPIEFIERNQLPFSAGNIVKYLTRWRDKGGIEDLRKAQQYLSFIESYDIVMPQEQAISVDTYISENAIAPEEGSVLIALVSLTDIQPKTERRRTLLEMQDSLADLIAMAESLDNPANKKRPRAGFRRLSGKWC